jgi:hypothetical protein
VRILIVVAQTVLSAAPRFFSAFRRSASIQNAETNLGAADMNVCATGLQQYAERERILLAPGWIVVSALPIRPKKYGRCCPRKAICHAYPECGADMNVCATGL